MNDELWKDDPTVQQKEAELAAIAKRRSELKSTLAEKETERETLLANMATGLLEVSGSKFIARYQNELSSLATVCMALQSAIAEADKKHASGSNELLLRKQDLSRGEIIDQAESIQDEVGEVVDILSSLNSQINSIFERYLRCKDLAGSLDLQLATLLPSDVFEGFQGVKFLRALELPHRLRVLKRNYPSLGSRFDDPGEPVEAHPAFNAPIRY